MKAPTTPKFFLLAGVLLMLHANESHAQVSGSSVRFLRGAKTGFRCGTRFLKPVATVYVGDRAYMQQKLEKQNSDPNITIRTKRVMGLRVENFAGRKVLGIDYSINKFSSTYPVDFKGYPETRIQTQYQHRVNISFNYVYMHRYRIRAYAGVQTGCELTRKNIVIEDTELYIWKKNYTPALNARVSCGIYYRISQAFMINLEGGYGGGAFVKCGVSVWGY